MNCPHCGTDLPSSAAFCPGCGRRLSGDPPPANAGDDTDPAAASQAASPPADLAQHLQQRAAQVRDTRDVVEQELWRGGYSYKAMVGTFASAGLISIVGLAILISYWNTAWLWWLDVIGLLLLWGAIGVTMLQRRLGIRYRLTNQRFFHESGIFRRITDRIEVIDIDDVQFAENLIERFFGVGSITISSTDRSMPKLWLQGIEHVASVANLIDQARRAERNRRGLYIESN